MPLGGLRDGDTTNAEIADYIAILETIGDQKGNASSGIVTRCITGRMRSEDHPAATVAVLNLKSHGEAPIPYPDP
ncbi:hypothetical protein [Xanthomonas oryzae]|uniref:hypothetical protein n=1 Tax=Xanthomonas oryzae TaxID=347 RepID=UPI0012D344EF|nr:hypothetical protein [Xanthomonas oryzae]UAD93001.1 hypothetical protein H9N23_07255 [Xanthomonas oryzae pv. oryzae]WDM96657.1 hypothetical protein LL927_22300 [Xanthomonas oryzae]WDN05693.1 hypothetical protein LL921_10580 [Xanthomonas oryzae]WDN06386.1 hypothetical protein LL922_13275 [Xanthomonas oryzae]WDN17929.1 hypothetical protein LL924_13450 [Xanthomonas oryzae]